MERALLPVRCLYADSFDDNCDDNSSPPPSLIELCNLVVSANLGSQNSDARQAFSDLVIEITV
jgi:hypothetical protein